MITKSVINAHLTTCDLSLRAIEQPSIILRWYLLLKVVTSEGISEYTLHHQVYVPHSVINQLTTRSIYHLCNSPDLVRGLSSWSGLAQL